MSLVPRPPFPEDKTLRKNLRKASAIKTCLTESPDTAQSYQRKSNRVAHWGKLRRPLLEIARPIPLRFSLLPCLERKTGREENMHGPMGRLDCLQQANRSFQHFFPSSWE